MTHTPTCWQPWQLRSGQSSTSERTDGSPAGLRTAQLQSEHLQSDLTRTVSSPEPGNAPPQPRRSTFPRFGSSSSVVQELRGMMARGELPDFAGQPPRPPMPQQSLARQATEPMSVAQDPQAWRRDLQLAAAAPDISHMAELRTTARAIEAEITQGYAALK